MEQRESFPLRNFSTKKRNKFPLNTAIVMGTLGLAAMVGPLGREPVSSEQKDILMIDDQGAEVARLQEEMIRRVPQCFQGPVTGYFGAATERGVKCIQDMMRFPYTEKDGRWGPKTESKFNTDPHFQIKK